MTTPLVIAVDAIRRGRGGPYVAAALVYQGKPPEPLFRYVDGRGSVREEHLLRKETLRDGVAQKLLSYVRHSSLAVVPYCLPARATPRNPEVARLVAMYWAVRKMGERLRYCHADAVKGLRAGDLQLLVAGEHPLHTRHFERLPQTTCPDYSDWRLQAAKFCAITAFRYFQ